MLIIYHQHSNIKTFGQYSQHRHQQTDAASIRHSQSLGLSFSLRRQRHAYRLRNVMMLSITVISHQRIMHTSTDKQNLKAYANADQAVTPLSKTHSTSKPVLSLAHSSPSNQQLADQLGLKIYQERIKNQQLYQLIKSKFQFFEFKLRPPLRPMEPCNALVSEYDKLLQERDNLQKELTKHQYHYQAIKKQKTHSFNFLLEPWRNHSRRANDSNEDKIDRMNKALVIMKQGIDSCLERQKNDSSELQTDAQPDREYATILRRLQASQAYLQQISQQHAAQLRDKNAQLTTLSQQNRQLLQRINRLEAEKQQYQQNEVELYHKINQLTEKLLQKQFKVEELRLNREGTRKYASKALDPSNCPLFEIFIKQNSIPPAKSSTTFIDKTFQQIEAFLMQSGPNPLKIDVKTASKQPDQDSESNYQGNQIEAPPIVDMEFDNCNDLKFYSTSKKPRKSRELLSGFKPRQLFADTESMKQMVFIRRR